VKLRNCPFPIFGKRLDYRKAWRWRGLWDRWQTSPKGFNNEPQPPKMYDPVPPNADLVNQPTGETLFP